MAARSRCRNSAHTRSTSRRPPLRTPYLHRLAFECLEDRRLLSCTVGDWVWQDVNSNGIQDAGEPGVAGVGVELFNAAGVSQKTTITDANGQYSFSDLTAGTSYDLVFHAPVGYSFALQDQGNDTADSDVTPSGSQAGYTALFTLGAGENRTDLDAGLTGAAPGFGYALGIGAASDDVGRAVATDALGNVYVTGAFQGTVDFDSGPGVVNLTSAGNNEIFVGKYSPTGALVWARRLGGTGNDYGYAIAVAADGGVYTTGYFSGTANFDPGTGTTNLASAGGQDIFVSKLNSDGNFVWARKMGGSSTDYGYAVAVANDGSVYTTGYFGGASGASASFGTTNLTSAGLQDIFVSKLDSAGNFLWASRAGGADVDYGYGIAVATDGSVYTTGYFGGTTGATANFGTINLTSAGVQDVFVCKLESADNDSAGNFVWAQRAGGAEADYGYSIALVADGSVYLTGSFRSTADFGTANLTSAGANDVFISKLNTLGSFIWTQRVGGGSADYGRGIAAALDGSVYTTGYFQGSPDFDPGTGTTKLTSAGGQDVFVWKLGSAGDFVSACSMGGSTDDYGFALALATDGSVYTTGYFNGAADLDPGVAAYNLTSAGGNDVFIAKLTADQPPEDILLSATSVAENQPAGTVVATLTSADADLPNETFTYSLASGTGDSGNTSFTIVGNQLQTATSFDYEAKSSYSIRLRTTDSGGRWYEKSFSISVTDVNEPSWVGGSTGYWTDPSNWSGDAVPSATDYVVINPASPTTVIIRPGESAVANSVIVGEGSTLSMPGGDPTFPASDLLTNGNFESPVVTGGSTTTPAANWNRSQTAYLSTQYACTGEQSLVISGDSYVRQIPSATAGVSYTLSAYAMMPASNPLTGDEAVRLQIVFVGAGGALVSPYYNVPLLSSSSSSGGPLSGSVGGQGWNHYWKTVAAPAGTESARVSIFASTTGQGGGAAYFDDVTFGPTVASSTLTAASVSNNGTILVGPNNTIAATGPFTQTSAGTLDIQLTGSPSLSAFGAVTVGGAATLSGTLKAELLYSYAPSTTDTFTPITFASHTGTFANYQLPGGTDYQFASSATFTNVVLSSCPSTPVSATIDTSSVVRPISTNVLGVNFRYGDQGLVIAQTQQMIAAVGFQMLRIPGGSASDAWHFNVNYNATESKNNFATLLQFVETVGATGLVTLDYQSASPQEAAAAIAYALGLPGDNTAIGNGILWIVDDDKTGAGHWEWYDWGTVGYWASLRSAAPLAEDDGLNFLRINRFAPFANMKYWEVGNEVDQDTSDHHGTDIHGSSTGAYQDPATYIAFAQQFAALASEITAAAGLPNVSVGIDVSTNGNSWTNGVFSQAAAAGFMPGFLSDHNYMQGTNVDDSLLLNHTVSDPANAHDWATRYAHFESLLLQNHFSSEQAVTVQMLGTEYNSTYVYAQDNSKQSTSLVNGLFVADSVGSLMASGYQGACLWGFREGWSSAGNLSNSLYGWRMGGENGIVGPWSPNDPPEVGAYIPFPGYFALQLASKFAQSGGEVVSAASNYTDLHVYAVQQASGHLSLLVINTNPAADLTTQFDLTGFQPSGDVQVWQYGKAEDTAQSQTTDGASALTNFSTTLSLSGSNFSYLFPAYSMTVLDLGRAVVTVTAKDASKTYGSADPVFSVSYVGFAPGGGPSNLGGTLAFTTNEPPTGHAPVGSYSITPSGLTASNYTIRFVPGTLSVTPAAMTATANAPASGMEGTAITVSGTAIDPTDPEAMPSFTWSVTKNGDPYATGSGASLTFTPDDQGTYVATLVAIDIHLSIGSVATTISVTDVRPTASIGGPATGPEGTPITLIGSASDPSSADAATLTYAWNVNKNGSFYIHGSGPNFTFTPNDQGTYVATLTASDKDGSGTASQTMTITDVPPGAWIIGPSSGSEGTPITLAGSASDPSTVDAAGGFTYTWNVTRNGNFYVRANGPSLAFTPNDQGSYLATLTAVETNGSSGMGTRTISVADVLPTAAISGPTTGTEGTAISLTGSATDPSSVDATAGFSYRWNVTKDNSAYSAGSGGSFVFTPNDQGSYVATLVATGRDGSSPAATRTITVRNAAPIASIGKTSNVSEGTSITLTGSATDPSSVDAAAGLSYGWRVNKDGNFYIQGSGTSFTFTPTDQGSYLATLTATDKDHGSGTTTRTVIVSNVAPTVTLSGPTTGEEGGPITLGSTVTDPSSDDTTRGFTYAWSVSRNGNFYMRATGSESFNFTPNDQGTYVATLTATDKDNGSRAGNLTIVVSSVAPTVTLSKPGAVNEGTAITLSGTVIDPSTADSAWGFTYAWNVTKNGIAYASGNDTSPAFTPDDNGTYTATLTATDKDGVSGTSSKTLTVGNVPPSVTINKPGTAVEGALLTLSAAVNDPSSADTAVGFGYDWSVTKNGSFYRHGTDASLTFTPDDNGTYVATLTASDKDGYSGTATRTFTVVNVAPTAGLGNNGPVAAGSTALVSFSAASDASSSDTTAGWRYAYDFDNNGIFEVGSGTYAGSVTAASATVPGSYLATPGTRVVHARIIDKDNDYTDYTTSITVGSPLLAQDVGAGGPASIVDQAAAQSILAAAVARWSAAGADVSSLRNAHLRIADLPGATLGLASPADQTIWLDINAAGHGWFIDATPQWDEEFVAQAAGDWLAQDPRAAHGMDLLTVISHELGRLLGRADLDPGANAGNLMDATLGEGIRRLPTSKSSTASVVARQFAIGAELRSAQLQARDDLFAGWDDGSEGLLVRPKHFRN